MGESTDIAEPVWYAPAPFSPGGRVNSNAESVAINL